MKLPSVEDAQSALREVLRLGKITTDLNLLILDVVDCMKERARRDLLAAPSQEYERWFRAAPKCVSRAIVVWLRRS